MASAGKIRNLMSAVSAASCRCPAHSAGSLSFGSKHVKSIQHPSVIHHRHNSEAGSMPLTDYAFEMKCSNIRFGPGVTREIGMDLEFMGAKKVLVVTDRNLVSLPPVKAVLESLHKSGIEFQVFDQVRIEPTDQSLLEAIDFTKQHSWDAFVAVGGGSVIDTAKAANLYSCDPGAEFLDYVNAPIGKGKPIKCPIKPLIAVPTTAGTGSETTGTVVFDYLALKSKTGFSSRSLCPTLGIIDPLHLKTLPERVAVYSGFDVLCHALESYTAIPFNERLPCPARPELRPAYQGSNPISDIWAMNTLDIMKKYFKRSVGDQGDIEAKSHMHLASSFAGIGFGNAGVHLCHAMSYPISGQVKGFRVADYKTDHDIIPHGLSVVMTAPAVFGFTAPVCPQRHLDAAQALGADISNKSLKDAGAVLSDTVRELMLHMKVDNGLAALGFSKQDIPELVKQTIPQERLTKLSPRPHTSESLTDLLQESMTVY